MHNYLNTFALYLLSALSLKNNQTERSVAFISLGEIAIAVGGGVSSHFFLLTPIVSLFRKISLSILIHKTILRFRGKRNQNRSNWKGKQFCPEALTCISMLASAVGPALIPHVNALIPQVCN